MTHLAKLKRENITAYKLSGQQETLGCKEMECKEAQW